MESTQETSNIPIHEIQIPFEDNHTLTSELSTLLTHHNQHAGYDTHHHGSSHHQTHPTGGTGGSNESGISKRAFQLAAVLGLLSLCGLLYADVNLNLHAEDAALDSWEVGSGDVSGIRGQQRFEEATSDVDRKKGWWHKLHESEEKKRHDEKKKKKGKAGKEPKASKHDDDDDGETKEQEEEDEEEDEIISTASDKEITDPSLNDNDPEQIIYPSTPLHQEPKLIPSSAITAATTDTKVFKPINIPTAQKRCDYVLQTFADQNVGISHNFLKEKYLAQSTDPNVFYRATATLFWKDFGARRWGQNSSINLQELVLLDEAQYADGTPLSPMSTWTWITGDQHLSNFGAWRNRGGEVVFSVNDFDEAAIYDFHIDVLRIAVSICNHGFTNGFSVEEVAEALETFTYKYVKTAIGYVGGDAALLYELTADTSTGVLRDFLEDVEKKKSRDKQLDKFTERGQDGVRRFSCNNETRLEDVPEELDRKIRDEIVSTRYGASLMKMGWRVRGWDDDFFEVLDIARRVGSGIGSYGVDRFYVLLKGKDASLQDDDDNSHVILDIKYEPISAVSRTLTKDETAWYEHIFKNEAERTAVAQRALTSFTDPYVGWIEIDGNPYYVRQRSPWKASFELGDLTDHNSFVEFIEQIAIATATSHVRGSVSKSPGQFKHVIKVLLAGDRNRRRWGNLVAKIAFHYRNQVLLDYECFKEYVGANFT